MDPTGDKYFLHVDMDAFFASVEQHDHPEYRGKPVVVGAPFDQRGVISAASYEAREFGIHSAMPSREAYKRCPHAIFVPVNGRRYSEVSRQIFTIFERFTPLVEPLSIDEAFLDVTGSRALFGPPESIGEQIRSAIRAETGLTASVGVAPNKFLAKLASDMQKPDGLTIVPRARAEIIAFLAPLPVKRLWGVGRATSESLYQIGIQTVADIQNTPESTLSHMIGKHGARHLRRLAFGEDAREIELDRVEKSISKEHTFATDCRDVERLHQTLADLVEDVGRRLRQSGNFARVAKLKLRWTDFTTLTRQKPFESPCSDDYSLRTLARDLFDAEPRRQAVRLIGFGVSGFEAQRQEQLSLFDAGQPARHKLDRLSEAVDTIRAQHGRHSIHRGGARDD